MFARLFSSSVTNAAPLTGEPILKAAHIVLAIYDCARNTLYIHDSQGGYEWTNPFTREVRTFSLASFFYPDKGTEMTGIHYAGTTHHNIQTKPHMCGYFVDTWLALIAKTPYLNAFKYVRLNPTDIQSKQFYLQNWEKITKKAIIRTKQRKDDADRMNYVSHALPLMSQGIVRVIDEYARTLKP